MSSRRYFSTGPSRLVEITFTRKGTLLIEGPCGWSQDFGPGLSISEAREYAHYHKIRCGRCRNRSIGYEVPQGETG